MQDWEGPSERAMILILKIELYSKATIYATIEYILHGFSYKREYNCPTKDFAV